MQHTPNIAVTLDEAGLKWLLNRLAQSVDATPAGRRFVVGIAGVPGAGKSTLAALLAERWNVAERSRCGSAIVVPMDGFHLSSATLAQLGLRNEKGTPRTFDAAAYAALLVLARRGDTLTFPIYDRELHDVVLRGIPQQQIGPDVRLIITEGNYLLLPDGHWPAVRASLDEAWFLATDLSLARKWIIDRHIRGGKSAELARAHYERVDRINTELVMENASAAGLALFRPAIDP